MLLKFGDNQHTNAQVKQVRLTDWSSPCFAANTAAALITDQMLRTSDVAETDVRLCGPSEKRATQMSEFMFATV